MNLQENIQRIKSMMGAIKELSETTDDVVGNKFWFEYHCFESPKSCDAELWYRTHNKVLVLSIVELGCGDTKLERLLEGCPRVYRVVFEDGFEYDVFEDELMESKEEFERPDAPKRNQQEQISRIQSMMNLNKSDKNMIRLLRRLETQDIKDYLNEQIDSLTDQINPCGYSTSEDYKDVIFEVAGANFINHFSDELYVKHEMSEIEEIIWDLLTKKYGNYLINQFDGRICDDEY